MSEHSGEPLLEIEGLEKYYTTNDGFLDRFLGGQEEVKAVDGVDLEIHEGETLGLVGESGCGKSSLGRSLVQLTEPTGGSVKYRGTELTELSRREMRDMRTNIQYIFQNPFASLNPRLTINDIVGEALDVHDILESDDEDDRSQSERRNERVEELLETVGLKASHANRYPHEFSGGQRQRIGIARALAVEPEFIVCDEPVSALDVSVQAQILNLLNELQEEFNLSYLFIAHDLSVVEHVADRIAVMYLGNIVETGDPEEVFSGDSHPYTEALLSAIPEPDPLWEGDRVILEGTVPSPIDPPSGCRFHTRCPKVIPPAEFEFDQDAFHSVFTLRLRLADAEAGLESVLSEPAEAADVPTAIRDEFGIPHQLQDARAEEIVSETLEEIATDDIERARERLESAFTTPCETDRPTLEAGEKHHPIACHRFDAAYADAVDEPPEALAPEIDR
ncbi:peptide/nickel transport system ATP-binding protein [Natronorubrum sediminis]|uniref:Peptide/nickel transport system ATP-binding protein n=1 Tax=Natronorubrum sediminis TaxID=640943 RepID=A0A1H6FNI2_9EURY|nr:ABC transporter ATP-binding protein [Natronorubrum sediminis]SEH12461.1 peptide/nickel transport system ATP-binding protein [Natronorubrum sediminis]